MLPHLAADEVAAFFDRHVDLLRVVDRAEGPPHAPPLGADAIEAFAWYALAVSEVAPERLVETLSRILQRTEDTIMSTLERTYRRGLAEGLAEGRAEGRALGLVHGRIEALLQFLTARFGTPTPDVEQRVRTASAAELDQWILRVATAASAQDVFRE